MSQKLSRHDKVNFDARGKGTSNRDGYLCADGVVVTRTGVFPYMNADGTIRYELRHPDDVFQKYSLDSLKNIPITLDHPQEIMVDSKNIARLGKGHVTENVQVDGSLVVAGVAITHDEAIEAIKNGKQELSLGYTLELVAENGEYNGQRYDYRQTNIEYNHLAIVDEARMGTIASINADCGIKQKEINNMPNENKPDMQTVTLDNGLRYQATPEVAVALDSMKKEKTELEAKLDHANAELKTAQVKADKLEAENKALKDASEANKKTAMDEAVKERCALLSIAAKHNVDGAEDMQEAELKKAVINKAQPSVSLDGKDENYINAMFDIVKQGVPTTAADQNANLNGNPANVNADKANADDYAKKRNEQIESKYKGMV